MTDYWATANHYDIKALSREDLKVTQCHSLSIDGEEWTRSPLEMALLYSQDSSIVGIYMERIFWMPGFSSLSALIANTQDSLLWHVSSQLLRDVVITEYHHASRHYEWIASEINNRHLLQGPPHHTHTLYKMHRTTYRRYLMWLYFFGML